MRSQLLLELGAGASRRLRGYSRILRTSARLLLKRLMSAEMSRMFVMHTKMSLKIEVFRSSATFGGVTAGACNVYLHEWDAK